MVADGVSIATIMVPGGLMVTVVHVLVTKGQAGQNVDTGVCITEM
jgi:hypothetical protein